MKTNHDDSSMPEKLKKQPRQMTFWESDDCKVPVTTGNSGRGKAVRPTRESSQTVVLVLSVAVLVLDRLVMNGFARRNRFHGIPPRAISNRVSRTRIDFSKSLADRLWNLPRFMDVLRVCDVIDDDTNGRDKTNLKRTVSMLTRLIQRTEAVSEESIGHEYRNAEYEYAGKVAEKHGICFTLRPIGRHRKKVHARYATRPCPTLPPSYFLPHRLSGATCAASHRLVFQKNRFER